LLLITAVHVSAGFGPGVGTPVPWVPKRRARSLASRRLSRAVGHALTAPNAGSARRTSCGVKSPPRWS